MVTFFITFWKKIDDASALNYSQQKKLSQNSQRVTQHL